MDKREPPHSPHPLPHQLQPENIVLVGLYPFTDIAPTTVMTPTTAQFPPSNINTNPFPHSEPLSIKPCVGASSSGSGSIKRNRGRPRKYFLDGNIALGTGSDPTQPTTFTSLSSSVGVKNTNGRGRGRPRGSLKKKQLVEIPGVTNGSGFSPHVILVNHGEDIVAKVGAFYQGRPNTDMCILSAHGLVGSVALYQSGTIVTYEGPFEIISLSGNLEVSDNTNGYKIMSYFKVCLTHGSHLLVGVVADKLIAASSVKVTVGSFTLDCKKTSLSNLKSGPSLVPSPLIATSETPTSASYQEPSPDSSDDNGNIPLNQVSGIYNNASQSIPTMSMYQDLRSGQSQQ